MTWSTAPETAEQAPWHHVRVHWPDGTSHLDGIRGWDEQHAIDNARWNWGTANPHGTCERVEYLGPEAEGDADGWFSSGADAAHQAYLDDLGHVNDDAAGAEA